MAAVDSWPPWPWGGGFHLGAFGGQMAWYTARDVSNPTHNASNRDLLIVDLAASSCVVTLPAPVAGNYVGVVVATHGAGNVLTVQDAAANVLGTYYAKGEAAWFGCDKLRNTWLVIASSTPECDFSALGSPVASWLSNGADANLSDQSGNARTLTKSGTIGRAAGVKMGAFASSYSKTYTRAGDAGLYITGALSLELVIKPTYNVGSVGNVFQHGSGAGGAINNQPYKVNFVLGASGTAIFNYLQQSGANVSANVQIQSYLSFDWVHLLITRSAAAAGQQTIKAFINGSLVQTASVVAETTGGQAANTFTLSPATAGNFDFQFLQVANAQWPDSYAPWLARTRLGGRVMA